MTSNDRTDSHRNDASLVRQTLRTVGLLVGACVIFVGVLSLIAVSIASRAVHPGASGAQATDTNETAKKPLSI